MAITKGTPKGAEKGAELEELVRAYFARQGFFVLRAVPYRFEGEDVTDLDVWLYSRQAASARIRGIVDVKNKRSPKAFERVLWVKGVQAALNFDRAIIATTDTNPKLAKYAQSQKIAVLSKNFLERLGKKLDTDKRLTLEQFTALVQSYPDHKQDGDWLRVLGEAKSAVASLSGFPAFNKIMISFRFFAERAEVRMQHREVAVRCALMTSGLACIALDSALERFVFENGDGRFDGLVEGVTYGDTGDGRVKMSIDMALSALSEGMQNGKAIAAQARAQLSKRLSEVRADVIAEHFMREHNAQHLFCVGKELDEAAHAIPLANSGPLSLEARAILGVFADFVGVKRSALPIGVSQDQAPVVAQTSSATPSASSKDSVAKVGVVDSPMQKPLL